MPGDKTDPVSNLLAGQGGARLPWTAVPLHIRTALQDWLGARITEVEQQSGGFSPGVAARTTTDAGRQRFVKAAGPQPNELAAQLHRREIGISRSLPTEVPAPRLLWSIDDSGTGWVLLVFDWVAGKPPR